MPTTYTSALRVAKPATGELSGTWGDVVNNNITTMFEQAIAGYASVAMSDANTTLTTANGTTDQARNMGLSLTGTLTAVRELIVPTVNKLYFIYNGTTGGFAVTVKTSAGTGVSLPNGKRMALICDGTNVVDGVTHVNATVTGNVVGSISGGSVSATSITASGTVTAAGGSVTSPAYAIVGDTNTGWYSPGADRLRLVTGGTSYFEMGSAGTAVFGANQTPNAGFRILVTGTGPAQTSARAFRDNTTISSSTTSDYVAISSFVATEAAAFTVPTLHHFSANQSTIGAGSSVTNQFGFVATNTLVGATNNYGFYGNIPAATGRWNLYMANSAQNYLAGNLGIGAGKSVPTYALDVDGFARAGGLYVEAGTAAAPSIAFDGDENTGFYSDTANELCMTLGGTRRAHFTFNGGFAFGSGTSVTANTYGLIDRLGSSPLPTLTAGTVLTLAGSTAVSSTAILQLISGSSGSCSVQFGDTDAAAMGRIVYDNGSDGYSFVVGGSVVGGWNSTGFAVGTNSISIAKLQSHASATGTALLGYFSNDSTGTASNSARIHLTAGGSTARGSYIESINTTGGTNGHDLVLATNAGSTAPTERLRLTHDGRVYGTALHNNAGAVTGTTNQYIASGTYTPTFTYTTNTGSSSGASGRWMRVGNVVTVSIQAGLTVSGGTGLTAINISLPIATTSGGAAGTALSFSAFSRIVAGTNVATMNFSSVVTASETWGFHFTYTVD